MREREEALTFGPSKERISRRERKIAKADEGKKINNKFEVRNLFLTLSLRTKGGKPSRKERKNLSTQTDNKRKFSSTPKSLRRPSTNDGEIVAKQIASHKRTTTKVT